MIRFIGYTIILSLFVCNSPVFSNEERAGKKVFSIENTLQDFDSWSTSNRDRGKRVIQLSKNQKEKWKKSKKVTICHIPPGNPDNAHTITVSESSVDAHLAHGDYIGTCEEYEPSPQREVGIIDVLQYHDINGSGSRDSDEYGLNGWEITIYDSRGVVASEITGEDRRLNRAGMVRFEVPPGYYRICQTLKSDWFNTEPGGSRPCKSVTIDPGEEELIYLGSNQYRDSQPDSDYSDCTPIEDIVANIDRSKGQKLTVCGTVVDTLKFDLVNFGAFQLDDGTGLIWAIPYGVVPSIRDEVSITGVIEVGTTIQNIPLGILIRGFTSSY